MVGLAIDRGVISLRRGSSLAFPDGNATRLDIDIDIDNDGEDKEVIGRVSVPRVQALLIDIETEYGIYPIEGA